MKKIIIYILMIAFLFSGCARTLIKTEGETTEEFYQKVTRMCKGRDVNIITFSNRDFIANYILIKHDSTFYKLTGTDKIIGIPTGQINKIKYKDPWPGLITGVGVGAASGLLAVLGLGSLGVFGKEFSAQGIIAIILIPLITITVGAIIGNERGGNVEINIHK